MLVKDSIVAICNYLAGPQDEFEGTPPAYYLMYIIDANGFLEVEMLRSLYNEMFGQLTTGPVTNHHKYIGPFENMSILNQYALSVCKKMNVKQISVLSLADYNCVIERTTDSLEILEALIKQGNKIENLEQRGKGGIFRKFMEIS